MTCPAIPRLPIEKWGKVLGSAKGARVDEIQDKKKEQVQDKKRQIVGTAGSCDGNLKEDRER